MATLKRKKENGTWEYVEVIGADVVNRLTTVESHVVEQATQIINLKRKLRMGVRV